MTVPVCQGTQKLRWSNRLKDTKQVCGRSENLPIPAQAKLSSCSSHNLVYFKTISSRYFFLFLFEVPNKFLSSTEKEKGEGFGIMLASVYGMKSRPSGPLHFLEERGWETSLNRQGSKCHGRSCTEDYNCLFQLRSTPLVKLKLRNLTRIFFSLSLMISGNSSTVSRKSYFLSNTYQTVYTESAFWHISHHLHQIKNVILSAAAGSWLFSLIFFHLLHLVTGIVLFGICNPGLSPAEFTCFKFSEP